jgi:hypothetical protein
MDIFAIEKWQSFYCHQNNHFKKRGRLVSLIKGVRQIRRTESSLAVTILSRISCLLIHHSCLVWLMEPVAPWMPAILKPLKYHGPKYGSSLGGLANRGSSSTLGDDPRIFYSYWIPGVDMSRWLLPGPALHSWTGRASGRSCRSLTCSYRLIRDAVTPIRDAIPS